MGGEMRIENDDWGQLWSLKNTTSHIFYPIPPTYAVSNVWLTLYFVSADVMLLAAIFSLVMRVRCRAPSVLGYVSSLARDSTYFEDCGL
ncbi:hypothetical protein P280DRAFT_524825, partial [Massarina eburnea CBS 473.64]